MKRLTRYKAALRSAIKTSAKPTSGTVDQDRRTDANEANRLWREMTRAGALVAEALEAQHRLMRLKGNDSPEQALQALRKSRETVELCARNYAAAVHAWRLAVLKEIASAPMDTGRSGSTDFGIPLHDLP